jgi:hypothetical protein
MKKQSWQIKAVQVCTTLLGLTLMFCLLPTTARAQGGNTGQAGVLGGNANAGTVTVTITSDTGAQATFSVDTTPGESVTDVMTALADKVNGDDRFTGQTGSFTIGSVNFGFQTVRTLNVRSISNGFKIKTVKIDPDQTGIQNYSGSCFVSDATGNNTPNTDFFQLDPFGQPGNGNVNICAWFTDSGSLVAYFTQTYADGTPVSTILAGVSSQLTSDGVNNQVNGDVLSLDTSARQTFLIGASPSEGFPSIAYEQSFTAEPVPEPSTLSLLGVAVVSLLARNWRRQKAKA